MFRGQRTRRSRWAVVAAAALTLLGAGLVAAIPAHAGVITIPDGFDGNPYERWIADYDHGRSIVHLGNIERARPDNGGVGAVWFDAPSSVPARIFSRPLAVESPGSPAICLAKAYVKPAEFPVSPTVKMGVRAEGAAPGSFLDVNTYILTNKEYGRAEFAYFPYTSKRMIIDISVTGGMALLDDVSLQCREELR